MRTAMDRVCEALQAAAKEHLGAGEPALEEIAQKFRANIPDTVKAVCDALAQAQGKKTAPPDPKKDAGKKAEKK